MIQDFNWNELIFEDPELPPLGEPFTCEQLKGAINQMRKRFCCQNARPPFRLRESRVVLRARALDQSVHGFMAWISFSFPLTPIPSLAIISSLLLALLCYILTLEVEGN
jgi:hypothetical protein